MWEILRIKEILQDIRQDKDPLQSRCDVQATAHMLAKTATEGLAYIENHCRESGRKIDLRSVRTHHWSPFNKVYPYTVLLPYARAQGLLDVQTQHRFQHDSITADQSNRQSEVGVLRLKSNECLGKADLDDESSGSFSEEND